MINTRAPDGANKHLIISHTLNSQHTLQGSFLFSFQGFRGVVSQKSPMNCRNEVNQFRLDSFPCQFMKILI